MEAVRIAVAAALLLAGGPVVRAQDRAAERARCQALLEPTAGLSRAVRGTLRALESGDASTATAGIQELSGELRVRATRAKETEAALRSALTAHRDALEDYAYELQRCAR